MKRKHTRLARPGLHVLAEAQHGSASEDYSRVSSFVDKLRPAAPNQHLVTKSTPYSTQTDHMQGTETV